MYMTSHKACMTRRAQRNKMYMTRPVWQDMCDKACKTRSVQHDLHDKMHKTRPVKHSEAWWGSYNKTCNEKHTPCMTKTFITWLHDETCKGGLQKTNMTRPKDRPACMMKPPWWDKTCESGLQKTNMTRSEGQAGAHAWQSLHDETRPVRVACRRLTWQDLNHEGQVGHAWQSLQDMTRPARVACTRLMWHNWRTGRACMTKTAWQDKTSESGLHKTNVTRPEGQAGHAWQDKWEWPAQD